MSSRISTLMHCSLYQTGYITGCPGLGHVRCAKTVISFVFVSRFVGFGSDNWTRALASREETNHWILEYSSDGIVLYTSKNSVSIWVHDCTGVYWIDHLAKKIKPYNLGQNKKGSYLGSESKNPSKETNISRVLCNNIALVTSWKD